MKTPMAARNLPRGEILGEKLAGVDNGMGFPFLAPGCSSRTTGAGI